MDWNECLLVYVMAAQGIFAAFVNGWYYKHPENTPVRIFPFN
jgi:heparan-alpha-glucosaminide N-acetyltransferase